MADYTLTAKLTADAKEFIAGFGKAKESVENLSDRMTNTGGKIAGFGAKTAAIGAGVTAGVTLPFIKAISTTADFDSAIRKAGAIAGATAEELKLMEEAALELGATTSLSGSEVATAMAEMAAKGFDATQTIAAMPGVIAAAEASGEDLALTADTVASAITGFGLSAADSTKVADVLAMTANMTAAGVSDLGYAFKYAAPVASSLGISMEELAAATGIMTNAGLEGSQAGTTLRMAMGRLISPTKEGAAALESLGVSAIDADGNFKPLNEIMGELEKGMNGMTDAQKQAALSTIFGTEAASGMAIMLSAGQEELKKLTAELENSGGASAEAAEQMKAGIGGALENLSGAIESLTIGLMSQLTPMLADLAGKVTGIIDKFNGMSESTKKIIAFGILAVAALGPLLTLFGFMTIGIGGLVTAMGTIISPIGLIIAGVLALVAVFAYFWTTSETFRTTMTSIFLTVKDLVLQAVGAIVAFVQERLTTLQAFWAANGQQILQAVQNVWNFIAPIIQVALNVALAVVKYIWNSIKGVIDGALNIIMGLIKIFAGLFTGDFSKMWEGVKQLFAGAIKFVWNLMNLTFVGGIRKLLVNLVSSGLKIIRGMWDDIAIRFMYGKDKAISIITNLRTSIMSGFNLVKSGATRVWNNVRDAIVNPIKKAKETLMGIIDAIKKAFSNMKIKIPKPNLPKISVSMKKGFMGIQYPSFSVDQLARGTDYWQGGFARMNEGGRGELVSLPEGTQVIPHDISMRYAREAGRMTAMRGDAATQQQTFKPYDGATFVFRSELNGRTISEEIIDDIDQLLGLGSDSASFLKGVR